jgi:hypothetical protein
MLIWKMPSNATAGEEFLVWSSECSLGFLQTSPSNYGDKALLATPTINGSTFKAFQISY